MRNMGVSRNEGYHFGGPIMRTIVFWGLDWGPLILGNYHVVTVAPTGF